MASKVGAELEGALRETAGSAPPEGASRAQSTEQAPAPVSGAIEISVYGALLVAQISWISFLGYVLLTAVSAG